MIIKSILDNDLYKFTMQHAVIQLFPRAEARYSFFNRDQRPFPIGFADRLRHEIKELEMLRLSLDEKQFLAKACPYLPPTYLDFLAGYRFDSREVHIEQTENVLKVEIDGYWYRNILWEVPLMALISELYFETNGQEAHDANQIISNVVSKSVTYDTLGVKYADFGTRRRFSVFNHELVVQTLKEHSKGGLIGTSNVHFAHKFNLKPIGTHAHEWFMFHGAKYGYKHSNRLALDNWVNVYRGNLGIALSDTFTSDIFFNAFDLQHAKLFDGIRQDSGDPLEFADKAIAHYKRLNIDPLSKTIIFSDGLNPETVAKISEHCQSRIKVSYGIGTNFTNDVGVKPLNIVVKMTSTQPENYDEWLPTVKLSDSKGKYTGDKTEVELCKRLLRIE